MCRVLKLEIRETQDELQELLRQQKTGLGKERVQTLYLLKTGQAQTVQHLAVVLGRSRITVQRWLKLYRQGGLNSLLEQKKSPGRPKTIPLDVRSLIKKELKDPEGFKSYEEVRTWLLASEGIKASYKVVHEVVRYKLKAKLKAPRPRSVKQNKGVEEDFKKNFTSGLELIKKYLISPLEQRKVRYWCGDESRFGLQTITGRLITLTGVKPVGFTQWKRDNFYIYGVVEPLTGENFVLEFSHLDTICNEQCFWKNLQHHTRKNYILFKLIMVHFTERNYLRVPENIILLFQPPHTPEVNPIERFWK